MEEKTTKRITEVHENFEQSPKKSNGLKRTITGLSMLAGFYIIVYGGIPLIVIMSFVIQIKCFDEVIKIGYNIKKMNGIPFFRTLNWYFLVVTNYLLFGETFIGHSQLYIKKYPILISLMHYHRFISFCLYFVGLICFMLILRKKVIRQQFSLLFWTHFLLLIISFQIYMFIEVMFEGLIWFIMSIWLVILNDVFAYVFGKYFGRTPLINLSPKKTVEGFVCGGLSTVVLGAILSYIFSHFRYLVCPIKYVEINDTIMQSYNCTPSYLFQPIPCEIPYTGLSINYYSFLEHSLYMSLFASIIAPFGGFCASGFKRAVGVKDFDDLFPGHGGLMDRFDCQLLMMTFVNVYISTFVKVKNPSVDSIFQKISSLSDESQLEFYLLLKNSLSDILMNHAQ